MAEDTVSVRNGNILFFGPAGSGKSHSLAALLKEKPPAIRESTGCTTAPVRAVAQFKIGVTGQAQFVRITDDQYSEIVVKSAEQFSLSTLSSTSMTTTSQSPPKHDSASTVSPTFSTVEKSSQPAVPVEETTSPERPSGLRKELLCRMQANRKDQITSTREICSTPETREDSQCFTKSSQSLSLTPPSGYSPLS